MPIVRSSFITPWYLRNAHLQTLWASVCRSRPKVIYERERLELADGDFIDLDWYGKHLRGPTVVVLHGLEGSSSSPYVRGLAARLYDEGFRTLVMHFRGCSGEPNRLDRAYHSGDTGDLQAVLTELGRRDPHGSIAVCGFSLGGNALLKYLGETSKDSLIQTAVAVSVPFVLDECALRLTQGFSRFYQWHLLQSMRQKMSHKFRTRTAPIDLIKTREWRTFHQFDHHVTAVLHGFDSGADYYRQCSARQYLPSITTPTLILQANDDPFMTQQVMPREDELSSATTLEISDHGGHVGFVNGLSSYWLDGRIAEHFRAFYTRN